MKSRYCTIMWNGRDCGASKLNEPPRTTPKAGLPPKKVMLCTQWDWKVVLYYELLPENQMTNFNKQCSQLDTLKVAFNGKCPELVNRNHIPFHQNNARLHISWMSRQTLLQLGWEILKDLFTGYCTLGCPFILVFTKFS